VSDEARTSDSSGSQGPHQSGHSSGDKSKEWSASSPFNEGPGSLIGPYKLLQVLGEGGFGIVYLAEQRAPVERRVALKVIKLGMDSREILARFEAERQALALMDHPNIAMVFDTGTTDRGRPYFAMEHIPGLPIHEYCDSNRLTTNERLSLFIPVCHAVQHAHQKGIIHRDLKPSNILVMLQDGKPVPKVIDFGIAKATSRRLTEKTIFTEQGRMIGTPEYMSPEQAGTTGMDVDTRTDIYSLGVVLYQLLIGALPFDSKSLRSAGYDEIMRIIREQEPPRMSTRMSSLGAEQTVLAEKRRSDPRALMQLMRGDLDWITTHALEKDRTRRYAAASDLAADIDRYLKSEPVLARPPSATYKMSRFVKRHRVGVAAGIAVTVALLAGIVGTTYGMISARQQRAIAVAQRQIAETETTKATAVNQFLQDMLASVDPADPNPRDVTVRALLDRSASKVGESFGQSPELEASLCNVIGRTYTSLGEFDAADSHLKRALKLRLAAHGPEHADVAESKNNLGQLLFRQAKYDLAQTEHREALAMRRKLKGDGSAEVVASLSNLAATVAAVADDKGLDEAATLLTEAVATGKTVLGAQHPDTINAMASLAAVKWRQGKADEAEQSFRTILALQRQSSGASVPTREMAWTMNNLAELLRNKGAIGEAESLMRSALEIQRKLQGDTHPDVVAGMGNLALILQSNGDLEGAETIFRGLVEVSRKSSREARPDIDIDLLNLANVMNDRGNSASAEPLAREALAICRARVPQSHPQLGFPLLLLGRILTENDRAAEAEPMLREAVANWSSSLPPGDWKIAQAQSALGGCLTKLSRFTDAEPLLLGAFPQIQAILGDSHLRTRQAAQRLADLYKAMGNTAKAAEYEALTRTK